MRRKKKMSFKTKLPFLCLDWLLGRGWGWGGQGWGGYCFMAVTFFVACGDAQHAAPTWLGAHIRPLRRDGACHAHIGAEHLQKAQGTVPCGGCVLSRAMLLRRRGKQASPLTPQHSHHISYPTHNHRATQAGKRGRRGSRAASTDRWTRLV